MFTKRFGVIAGIIAVAAILTGCHALREDQDVLTYYNLDSSVYSQVLFDVGHSGDYQNVVWNDINTNCVSGVSGGDWGDVGSSTDTWVSSSLDVNYISDLGTPPSNATIDCVQAEILDDPNSNNDNESIICDDAGTANDCQDPDGGGMGTYKLLSAETDWYQTTAAANSSTGGDTRARTAAFIVGIRDWYYEDANTGAGSGCLSVAGQRCVKRASGFGSVDEVVDCAVLRADSTWITAVGNSKDQTFAWATICP